MIRRQLMPAIVMLAIFTVVLGLGYPLLVTGAAQITMPDAANGSLITRDGVKVGSSLIGQQFTQAKYFHPRPSAAGAGYDTGASGGSNLGPSSDVLLKSVAKRVAAYRTENHLSTDATVPVDAVTASGSGLDPHISIANARLQANRVATTRSLPVTTVLKLIAENTEDRSLGFLGDPGVNVLRLNLAIDAAS